MQTEAQKVAVREKGLLRKGCLTHKKYRWPKSLIVVAMSARYFLVELHLLLICLTFFRPNCCTSTQHKLTGTELQCYVFSNLDQENLSALKEKKKKKVCFVDSVDQRLQQLYLCCFILAFVLGQVGFQKISKLIQVTFVDKCKQPVKIIGTFCANSGVVALSKKDLAEKILHAATAIFDPCLL